MENAGSDSRIPVTLLSSRAWHATMSPDRQGTPRVALPSLGNELRRLRRLRGFTQKAVGDAVRVNTDTVGRWERDQNVPGPDVVEVLIDFLRPERRLARRLRSVHKRTGLTETGTKVIPISTTMHNPSALSTQGELKEDFLGSLILAIEAGALEGTELHSVARFLALHLGMDWPG